MSSKALRRNAATLIVTALITFSAATPAHALGRTGRRAGDASWTAPAPGRGFLALLFRLIAKAGGAMDPNGSPTDTGGVKDPNGSTTDAGGALDPNGKP